MKKANPILALLSVAAVACASTTEPEGVVERSAPLPGWFLSGSQQQSFRAAADLEVKRSGRASGRLESTAANVSGAGTLMQTVPAREYQGKRLRFSAFVKTKELGGWAGLWMRIDAADGRSPFDNMQDRPLRATGEWSRHEVVLDVPDDATSVHFGLLQDGAGISWIDDAKLEVVGSDVPVTDLDRRPRSLENAGFEAPGTAPEGWFVSGVAKDDFVSVVDRTEKHGGASSAKLTNRVDEPRGHAALKQSIRAEDYLGKRLRVSAWVKGRDISTRGGALWVQAVTPTSPQFSKGISWGGCEFAGSFEWKQCTAVLDIPSRSDAIHVSVGVQAKGTLWIDDVAIEEVGPEVPVSSVDDRPRALVNGGFEHPGAEPAGWSISGGGRAHYEAIVDPLEKHGGRSSVRFRPRVEQPQGYGTVATDFRAEDYRGKRLRMTAWTKGVGIDARGDLWLRVQAIDSSGDGPGLGGGACSQSGSFDWKPCTIVFDVPGRGDEIQVGVGLAGHGTLWLDDVAFEEVDATVPVTNPREAPSRLVDGTFEGGAKWPSGWFMSGGAASEFEASVDEAVRASGTSSARLRPRVERPSGYGTLMVNLLAATHRGKRMRMTAQVKGEGITARGDMWLRVQAENSPPDGPGLGGGACTLAQTFDWRPCEIVFDVPERGAAIQFGIGLAGPGTIWMDDVSLDEVAASVPVTDRVRDALHPENLDLEP